MSQFGKQGRRCDYCGKFTTSRDGEYARPVKNAHGVPLAGYIRRPFWEVNDDGSDRVPDEGRDVCEECAADLCPNCGGKDVVRVTPAAPGPDGWGGRCKGCGHRWSMPVPVEPEDDEPMDGPIRNVDYGYGPI